MPFGKLQAGCDVPFTKEWLPSSHSAIKARLVECCRDGYPSGRFYNLHRETLELCQTGHWVLGHLPAQGHLPQLVSLAWRPPLGGSKLLPFKNDGGHHVLGDLQSCRQVLVPFPRSVPRHNPVSALYGQFLQPHGLVFAPQLTCTVNCGTLYRQMCAFQNHVQSIEFTTDGL